ncbi:MAG TPA: molybdopterin molybdotransferase MoeA, partial [Candidatus Hydrogenedentes bacterium]|nr:molybdopterin molybdotransferase MoeA [Candidatus Hydrogenedentota bacterium]
QQIGLLASVGCVRPLVARRPRVGVIATGDELVEPDRQPGPAEIRTSNSVQLCVHIEEAGAIVAYYGIARDEADALDTIVRRALSENDVVVLSGGVSMGDFDFVPDTLRKNGIDILFDSVAVKPGKPTTFGVGASTYCIGLPGNPVSTFVQCELLVKPFLYALMGREYAPALFRAPLATPYRRKKADRQGWFPASVAESGEVTPIDYHGPAHLGAVGCANALMMIPRGVPEFEKGALVSVRPI